MANGKIIYDVNGIPTTYIFAINYSFGHKPGYLDTDARKRALDGTAYENKGPRKQFWEMTFTGAPLSQKEAFEAAYESGYEVGFYLDADDGWFLGGGWFRAPWFGEIPVIFAAPPEIQSEAAFVAGMHTWEISVRFEDI